MDIIMKQDEEATYNHRESIDVSMNSISQVKLSRDKKDMDYTYIKIKAKNKYDKKTYSLSEVEIGHILRILFEISETDILDTLEKNVYVLPFASTQFKGFIEKLRDMSKIITVK